MAEGIHFHRGLGELPGSPVVKTLPSSSGGAGLIPAQGDKIPYCLRVQKPKHETSNIATKSTKTSKMVHFKNLKNLKKKPAGVRISVYLKY